MNQKPGIPTTEQLDRRSFLRRGGAALGGAALACALAPERVSLGADPGDETKRGIIFKAYNLAGQNPRDNVFQLNLMLPDDRSRSVFVRVGEKLPFAPKFKIKSFQFKQILDANNEKVDASELTITDAVTGMDIVLPIGKIVNLE